MTAGVVDTGRLKSKSRRVVGDPPDEAVEAEVSAQPVATVLNEVACPRLRTHDSVAFVQRTALLWVVPVIERWTGVGRYSGGIASPSRAICLP